MQFGGAGPAGCHPLAQFPRFGEFGEESGAPHSALAVGVVVVGVIRGGVSSAVGFAGGPGARLCVGSRAAAIGHGRTLSSMFARFLPIGPTRSSGLANVISRDDIRLRVPA